MLTDMKIFNTQLQKAIVMKADQKTVAFNEASGGALLLVNSKMSGDFREEAVWNDVSSALRDVDGYAAQAVEAATSLTQSQINSVKTMKAIGPIQWEPAQLAWIDKDAGEALRVISESLSTAIVQDQLNKAVGVLVAAMANNAAAVNDVTAGAGLLGAVTQSSLNATHALFGDSSASLTAHVMTGGTAHRLLGQAIADKVIYTVGRVNVIDFLGRVTIVTDSPALVAGTDKERVLCLSSGAIAIESNDDFVQNIVTSNGSTRLETTYQAEYTENVRVSGYSWDMAAGGKSPVKADLETGSNWVPHGTLKSSAGVLLIGDPTKG